LPPRALVRARNQEGRRGAGGRAGVVTPPEPGRPGWPPPAPGAEPQSQDRPAWPPPPGAEPQPDDRPASLPPPGGAGRGGGPAARGLVLVGGVGAAAGRAVVRPPP